MNIKKLAAIMVAVASLNTVFAAEATQFRSHKYDLKPNEVVTIKGKLLHKKTLNCDIRAELSNSVNIELASIKHNNIVDKVIVPEGQSILVTKPIGANLNIEMDVRARLGVVNRSAGLVSLNCD